jgi:hypothetical protein
VPNLALLLTDQAVALGLPDDLKPALESTVLQILGSSTPEDWKRAREQSASVCGRFDEQEC